MSRIIPKLIGGKIGGKIGPKIGRATGELCIQPFTIPVDGKQHDDCPK